jgi:RNA polymerase sigma factor (sigma-70 family)
MTTDLLRRIFEGDRTAVTTLHDTMRRAIGEAMRKRGCDADRGADIYAETCTILLENYYHGKLKADTNIGGFMMNTAKNLLHTEQRQIVRYGATLSEDYDEPDDLLTALDNMILSQDLLRIAKALQGFNDRDRHLLIEHAVEGVPLAALARQQNEKETTVRQRFNRALFKLKTAFG